MKLVVVGFGQCGSKIADEFSRLNSRARSRRGVEILSGVFAVNTDVADLSSLSSVKSDYQHRILIGTRKTNSHGVGKINEVGAEIARQDGDKVVYSRTLDSASTPRTRIESEFDSRAVRRMKEAADADLSVGGPVLAAEALRAGLVDQLDQVVYPVIVGGGTHWLPDNLRLDLELLEERRFAGGAVHLRYRA